MDRTIANRLLDEASSVFAGQELRAKHFDVFAVYLPANYDGSQLIDSPTPRVRLIQPRPSVIDKDVITATEGTGGGMEQARLQRYEMTGISRTYTDSDLRPDFWLVLTPGTQVTPLTALTIRPRYRNLGVPTVRQNESIVTIVEER